MTGHAPGRSCPGWPHCHAATGELLEARSEYVLKGAFDPELAEVLADTLVSVTAELEERR